MSRTVISGFFAQHGIDSICSGGTMCKERIKLAFGNISTFVKYVTGSEALSFYPGTQIERQKKKTIFWLILSTAVIISIILCFYIPWNKYYRGIVDKNIDGTYWLGFIASFWGAIIGAVISGVATVITTWLIIRRSYRIDYHRERIEFLPILELSIRKDLEIEIQKEKDKEKVIKKYKMWNRDWNDLPEIFSVFEVKNVGKGIAIKPKISNFAEAAIYGAPYFSSIGSQESVYFVEDMLILLGDKIVFSFFDIFDNYYEQSFTLEKDSGKRAWNASMSMPKLVVKTQRIRYEQ